MKDSRCLTPTSHVTCHVKNDINIRMVKWRSRNNSSKQLHRNSKKKHKLKDSAKSDMCVTANGCYKLDFKCTHNNIYSNSNDFSNGFSNTSSWKRLFKRLSSKWITSYLTAAMILWLWLLLTIHTSGVEEEGNPQDVGGRKIGQRPAVQPDVQPVDSEDTPAPPIGSDVQDPGTAKTDKANSADLNPSEQDGNVPNQEQNSQANDALSAEEKQKTDSEKLTDNTEENSIKTLENPEKDLKEKPGEEQKVIYLGEGKEGEEEKKEKNEKHSTEEPKATPECTDCGTPPTVEKPKEEKVEAGSDGAASEVLKEEEKTEKEEAGKEEQVQEGEQKQPEVVVVKEAEVVAVEQDTKPAEGDAEVVEKDVQQPEELSTVQLPPVGNKLEGDTGGAPEQQQQQQQVQPPPVPPPAAAPVTDPPPMEEQVEHKDHGDITAPTQDSDMPSFDEWKKRMLAEQAQQEKSKQLEAQVVHTSSGSNNKKPGKGRNYASLNCGAKVLAANPEAQNTGSVLSENRDSYIIQPCKAKKWFVVELCEPVQVRSLEIANLELFSSLPEKFVVNISDRYPTKEWKTLGTFRARDERAIQTFSVEDVDIYAKYIRIEMLSHYGREHYCPLTILRVFGTTVEEDDDADHHDHDPTPEDAADAEEGTQEEEPANLFTTATGTVLSLVKTVLSPGEKEGQEEKLMEGVVKLNGTAVNQSAVNVTEPPVEGEKKEPCAPSGGMDDKHKDEGVKPSKVTQPEAPEPSMLINGNIPPASAPGFGGRTVGGRSVAPTVEKQQEGSTVAKEEKKPPRMVTLIESPISLNTVLSKCHYCEKPGGVNECYFDTTTACGYYKFLKYVYPTCCFHKGKIIHEVPIPNLNKNGKPRKGVNLSQTNQKVDDAAIKSNDMGGQAMVEESLKPSRVTSTHDALSSKATESLSLTKVTQLDPNASQNGVVTPPETVKATATLEMTPTAPQTAAESAMGSCDNKGDAASTSCINMGPELVQIRPTSTIEETATIAATPTLAVPDASVEAGSGSAQGQGQAEAQAQKETMNKQVPTPVDIKPPPPEPTERVIHAEEAVDTEFEQAPMQDTEQELVKYSSEKKQTTFMKLKNRIKMLELNLNLSSRYLEELSQRYKRQMEEMYVSLNRTITKLTNTSKSAEARDLKQQEHISQLQKRISNLTSQLTAVTSNLANIHSEVIERHLFLMLIELAAFSLLFTWCLNRNTQKEDKGLKVVEIKAPPEQARVQAVVTPKKQMLKRRNSIGSSPSEKSKEKEIKEEELTARRSVDDLALRWSGSEGSFGIVDPSTNVFINQNPDDKIMDWKDSVPRRRKKKHKGKHSLGLYQTSSSTDLSVKSTPPSSSNSQDGDNYPPSGRRTQSFGSWAGVLFSKVAPSSENGSKHEVHHTSSEGSKDRSKQERDRRKQPFKGRRSLDSHMNGNVNGVARSDSSSKINGHKSSHINGDLNSIPPHVSQQNSCPSLGRTDLPPLSNSGPEPRRKSSSMNGSPGYNTKEGNWKNFHS